MKFIVTIDRDEDGVWVVECPSIPGCVSQGATRGEALENVKDAIAACLAVRSECVVVVPFRGADPISELGRDPITVDVDDASDNHDRYLYGQ